METRDDTVGGYRSPAAERNRKPILDVLARVLPASGTVLEVASGTGQHVAFFAGALPALVWQPTELDPHTFGSIAAWTEAGRLANVHPPLALDVTAADWPVGKFDAILNANMIHVSPWETCVGLMRGARMHLSAGGVLVLYGPFRIDGKHTSPSNNAFDVDLRSRNPEWGVRDLEAVVDAARANGLGFEAQVPMPANNQTLVFRA